MDNPPVEDRKMQEQLSLYREEQRRRHEQLSNESTNPPIVPQYHASPSLSDHLSRPTPSAPPLPNDHEDRDLYPALNPSSSSNNLKKSQEEEDERLARQLQEEENTTQRIPPNIDNPQQQSPSQNTDVEEDEQLALALQESEQFEQTQQSPPQPQPPSGILSTLGNIGRGLYNAYTTYSQVHQQAQHDAEQQSQQQIREYNTIPRGYDTQTQQRQQVESDEALARRIQEEEANAEAEERMRVHQMPRRQPPVQFVYRHPPANSHLSPFGYDSDDESSEMFESPHANPRDQLRTLNSLFRSTGAEPDEPLFHHLQELMRQTRHPIGFQATLPRHRYVFPGPAFQAQGVEELPPDLLGMMQGQTDTSYESLLELAERMQPVSRGASDEQIDQLPTRTFSEGSMPQEHSKCGICLADYEPGEELTSLPCLHSFHKECISHWLTINKICPVCRVEIAAGRS